jgi:RNA polymerase sigma-70 factor (ECF subfamily)
MVVSRPLPEQDLVARAKTGDLAAYEELVRMHEHIAFRTAKVIAGSGAVARDATQEAFIKAHRSLSRFRTGSPFRPWLLRIVANECRNEWRSAARRARLAQRTSDDRSAVQSAPSPETALLVSERHDHLVAALDGLAEDHRRVICCRYLLELSEEETAAVLGCRRGTVKSRQSRALEQLRQEMSGLGD